jgi:hypothetical protein
MKLWVMLLVFYIGDLAAIDNQTAVTDEINQLYNDSLNSSLAEFSPIKVAKNNHLWSISNAIKIHEHLGIEFTESNVEMLHEFIAEVTDSNTYQGKSYTRLFTTFAERLNSYIDLTALKELRLNKEYILSEQINGTPVQFIIESKHPRKVTLDDSVCIKNDLGNYACDVQNVSLVASVSIIPLSVQVKLELPFLKVVLSKLLGGNETLLNLDYPIYVIPSQIGKVTMLGAEQVNEKSEKTFQFSVSYRNAHCKSSTNKSFGYNIPPNYSVIGQPIFSGKVDGTIKKILVTGNKITLNARIRNKGECLEILGSKLSSDARGSISGTVIVKASTDIMTNKPITLLDKPITWGEELTLQLGENAFSSGLIFVNESEGLDVFDSPFLQVTKSDDEVVVRAKSIEQFLRANSLD